MRSGCASSAPHPFPNLPPDLIGAIDPHALKIPAPKGRNTRYPETATLHFRLNQDTTSSTKCFAVAASRCPRVQITISLLSASIALQSHTSPAHGYLAAIVGVTFLSLQYRNPQSSSSCIRWLF